MVWVARSVLLRIAGWLSLAAVIGALVWYGTSTRVTDAMLITECRQYYARATTHADTVRIDGIVPERTGRASAAVRCGEIRRVYPDLSRRQ